MIPRPHSLRWFLDVTTHAQKAVNEFIYSETADDFVLSDPDDPDGDNPCRLDEVRFAVWHEFVGISPADWEGVKITIYEDRGPVCMGQPLELQCQLNPDKGPGGYPTPSLDDRQHTPCCSNPDQLVVVCDLKLTMSSVAWVPIPELADAYDITVSGLGALGCDLQKNRKYWVAPTPVMHLFDPDAGVLLGLTYVITSPVPVDHEAQVISDWLAIHQWARLQTQLGLPDGDLFLAIGAYKPCPWDCIGDDGIVGIAEFLAVLGTWGQTGVPCDFDGDGVGITDFLKVLGVWGVCP